MMKRKHLLIKCIAVMLLIATLLPMLPVNAISLGATDTLSPNGEDLATVVVLHNGAEKSSVTLEEGGKETLTALIGDVDYTSRSWQIRTPDGEHWIDIYGKNGDTLDVTYALVQSMLDAGDRAYLRHIIKEDNKTYASAPVEIVISHGSFAQNELLGGSSTTFAAARPVAAQTAPLADDSYDEGDTQLVSIVINYIFDNGGLAFEPYGASIAKGSSFQATVTSPTVMGYDPFRRIDVYDENGVIVGSDYVSAKTVVIDMAAVNDNITINVIYEPAIVKFEVHHHLQDLNDDAYSIQADYRTYGYGLTGSRVPTDLEMDIPGFKSLAYDTSITIAADGSTVVEIRYDRVYYLVSFDMAGGYGTDPVYTRYGTRVGANPPTRHGYVFDGWELISYGGNTPTDAQKSAYDINGAGKVIVLPDANLIYRASWITQLTTYTMVFWKENINDNGFTYWGYLDGIAALSGTTVNGSDRVKEVSGIDDEAYFTYCDAMTEKNVIVEGDGSTVVNVYYTRNRYSITFKGKGKCVIEEKHTHTLENCYVAFCKGGHVHDESCTPVLSCPFTDHAAHTDACIKCGLTEHTHTDACYCGNAEHTHVAACWNITTNAVNAPNRAPSNPQQGQIYKSGNTRYIYIGTKWYRITGSSASSGDIVDPKCGKTVHTHNTSCKTCSFDTEHTHTDSCYKDTLHTHGDSCYRYSCGKDEHTHTDACYLLNCGITENHTHSSTCKSSTATSNVIKVVYRKYQEDISSIWPIVDGNGVTYNSGERWKPSGSSLYSEVLVFIANMPPENLTLTLDTSTASTYTMNYYLEVLPGEPYTHSYGGRNYVLYTTVKANYNYITQAEDFFAINGFDQLDSNPKFSNGQIKINSGSKNVNFYYSRIVDHALEFSNNGNVLNQNTVTGIMYGMPLQDYNFTPSYPTNLETGAYTFAGWYTSPGCFDGTEVNWNTLTMPAGDILLYAKWVPIVHTVEIYSSYQDGVYKDQIGDAQYVSHNHFASSPDKNPTNGNYVFQGWFYIDAADGMEKAFVFTGIPVDQDMKIYAKWSSHISVAYEINYVLKIDGTKIADTEIGQGIAGDNKTFLAKVDNELYAGYRTGFYPLTSSHTVTMSAEKEKHVYTFEYVYVESMPYAVRYVDEKTGALLLETKKVMDNTLSVVTETFVKVSKMMPDADQKRLILSAEGEDLDNDGILDNNVITFKYVADEQNAYYKVVHYIQNIAADGYREYRSEETKGVIGSSCVFTPITVTGFAFNPSKAMLNGQPVTVNGDGQVVATLGADGMLVELYYDRVNVDYTVNYLENGTDKVLYTQKVGTGIFGGQVAERAPGLTHLGYTLVGDSLKQLHLSSDAGVNVINFYYQESTYSLRYQIVGSEDGGRLSINSENVQAVSGNANGSTPTINRGYKFLGWFLDEACSRPVPAEWVDAATNKLTPQRDGVWTSSAVFYAKIIPDVSTLTIQTLGAAAADADQVFIFRVKGTSENVKNVDFTVTVMGNSSITISDIEIGDYTVTELTDWSFRYTVVNATKGISLAVDGNKNVVAFAHIKSQNQWLDGNDSVTNLFSNDSP